MERLYTAGLVALVSSAPILFVSLFFITAPYGRYAPRGRGVPTRLAWLVMELPAVVVPILLFLRAPTRSIAAGLFLILWLTHYVYRTFIYTALMKGGSRGGVPGLLAGLALLFNCVNGYVNWFHLPGYGDRWLLDPRFIAGVVIFGYGWWIHVSSDGRLRSLRRGGNTGYSIPRGGLFDLVSAPNYFGEIVQWSGWAIATWSLPGLAFALFTAANLVPRALSHHRWYRERFEEYPPGRKAVIPYLF